MRSPFSILNSMEPIFISTTSIPPRNPRSMTLLKIMRLNIQIIKSNLVPYQSFISENASGYVDSNTKHPMSHNH